MIFQNYSNIEVILDTQQQQAVRASGITLEIDLVP